MDFQVRISYHLNIELRFGYIGWYRKHHQSNSWYNIDLLFHSHAHMPYLDRYNFIYESWIRSHTAQIMFSYDLRATARDIGMFYWFWPNWACKERTQSLKNHHNYLKFTMTSLKTTVNEILDKEYLHIVTCYLISGHRPSNVFLGIYIGQSPFGINVQNSLDPDQNKMKILDEVNPKPPQLWFGLILEDLW